MPLTSILILTGIVSAFALFGIMLAWAEHQTRELPRKHSVRDASAPSVELKRAA